MTVAMVAACDGTPPSPAATATATASATTSAQADPSVAAIWVADDGSVVAINLVVAAGTGPRQVRELADERRREHPGARVIVRIFASTAGPERFIIGHVPAADEPLAETEVPPSRIALYDFPP